LAPGRQKACNHLAVPISGASKNSRSLSYSSPCKDLGQATKIFRMKWV
jgi:hypothetical protein